MTALLTKQTDRPEIILTDKQKDQWVLSYEKTKKIPSLRVPCVKCNLGVVMGYDNLHNRVKKFGGIRQLLNEFVCKDCIAGLQPIKGDRENVWLVPKVKRDKSIPIVYDIPVYKQTKPIEYSIEEIAKDPALAEKLTKGHCMQPHVYLNNNKSCHACLLKMVCHSSLAKRFRQKCGITT